MNTKIAILRGINVGGKRKILMNDLKLLCKKMGLKDVHTYIQSGNLIFKSEKHPTELEKELEKTIAENYGFQIPIIILKATDLQNAVAKNPFLSEVNDTKQLHLTLLKEKPKQESIDKILSYNFEPDQFKIDHKNVFLWCKGKYHQSKLSTNFFEKNLNVQATTRNWNTILKLLQMTKV